MLIISRKRDQKIIVADEIEITILEVGRNRVRFGIKAPKHIPIQTKLKTSPVAAQSSAATMDTTNEPESSVQTFPEIVGLSASH
jgi:carbon storage regulator CsrA